MEPQTRDGADEVAALSVTSTMMDFPLTIGHILRHGRDIHGNSVVTTWAPGGPRDATFVEIAERVDRLASLLKRIGIKTGDVVGTLSWNHSEHLETYFAIPAMGAVLHTINLRLSPDQLAHVINNAGDRVLIADASLLQLLIPIASQLHKLRHIIVIGTVDPTLRLGDIEITGCYEDLVRNEPATFAWPAVDERSAAAMCYTSGTTGDARGVVYSHRSQVLHSLSINSAANFALTERDRILIIVPFFHANAWGLPYAGWWAGADLLLPQQYLQPEHLSVMIRSQRPTVSAAVPTIWNDLLNYEAHDVDLSSLREIISGGAAVPLALIERFKRRFGLFLTQGWGMTECSPLAALARPPKHCTEADELRYRAKTGRVIPGIELRLVAEGIVQPWDDQAVGEIQLRGPWVSGGYFAADTPNNFQDGWLRTGDVGTVDGQGFISLTDRAKDVIKSGGEWISSMALENALMAHADVLEAAVIGVADERWGERPLPCVVLRAAVRTGATELTEWLATRFPRWWLPDRWAFVSRVPRTAVGKFDKKVLRAQYSAGQLEVIKLPT